MKKFTKLFLSCALVSAMAVTAAASAFAATPSEATYAITGGLTGTYTTSSNDITGLKVDGAEVKLETGSQVTFLVYKKGADSTSVAAADVIGIDQGEAIQPVNNGLIADSVEETEGQQTVYVVKVGYTPAGGQFTVASGEFAVGENPTPDYLVGDADGEDGITIADAGAIASHVMEKELITDDTRLKAADADLADGITIADAGAIAEYVMEKVNLSESPIGKPPVK